MFTNVHRYIFICNHGSLSWFFSCCFYMCNVMTYVQLKGHFTVCITLQNPAFSTFNFQFPKVLKHQRLKEVVCFERLLTLLWSQALSAFCWTILTSELTHGLLCAIFISIIAMKCLFISGYCSACNVMTYSTIPSLSVRIIARRQEKYQPISVCYTFKTECQFPVNNAVLELLKCI